MSSFHEATPSTSAGVSMPALHGKRGAGGDEVEGHQKRRRANSVPAPSRPVPDPSLVPQLPELVFTKGAGLAPGERIRVDLGHASTAVDGLVSDVEPLMGEEFLLPAHAPVITVGPASDDGPASDGPAPVDAGVAQTPPVVDGATTQPAAAAAAGPALAADLRICSKRCGGAARPLAAFTRSKYPHGALEPKAQCNECNRKYVRRVSVADFQALYLTPDAALHALWLEEERQRRLELQQANALAALALQEPETPATEGDGAALEAPLPEGAGPAEETQAE